MNKERRKIIATQYKALEVLNGKFTQLVADAEAIKSELEAVRDSEQEAFDNMPEGLQQGEKGQASEQAISELETAIDSLEELTSMSDFSDSMTALDNAEHG